MKFPLSDLQIKVDGKFYCRGCVMVSRISSVENILRRVKVSVNILSKFYTSREEKYAFYGLSDNASIGSYYTLPFPFVDFHYEKVKLFHNFMFCYFPLTNDVACC